MYLRGRADVLVQVVAQAAGGTGELPVDLLRWLLAVSPILLLLVLLVVFQWGATEAGPLGVAISVVVAATAFDTPLRTLVVAGAKGVWDAVPILLVIFAALLLYRIGTAAGAFHALRVGVEQQSRNSMFLVLAFGWVFASFTQGIAGFGAPIAIVAPILVALRVRPVYAVVIPLIGHAWAKFFGTLGVGWVATLQVTEVEDPRMTALLTSLLLLIPIFAAGFAIAWMVGRAPGVKHALPMVLVVGTVLGVGQIGFSFISPELSSFLAATLALLSLYPLSRWSRYSQEAPIEEMPAMAEDEAGASGAAEEPEPVMGLGWTLFPYAVLTVVAVLVLLVEPVESFLEGVSIAPSFPEVSTGFGVVNEASNAYEPLTPLAHPGGFLVLAALAAWPVYRLRGFFRSWRERADAPPVLSTTVSEFVPAATAVVTFLILASVMSHSGETEVFALGIAAVAPPLVYAFLANIIGIVGALVTNSSTSSNVLFSPVHTAVAANLGISQAAVLAAQSTGGAVGNVVAPTNIILGTTTAGASGKEGEIMRMTIPWAAAVAVLTGLATMLLI
jgi:lactate permease